MDMDLLRAELRRDEGLRLTPYRDTEGIWTCGYGHNLEANAEDITHLQLSGISMQTAEDWLEADIKKAIREAKNFVIPVFDALSDSRQRVLVNMAFNLGGRLRDFKRLRAALLLGYWKRAEEEMKHSRWSSQVGDRAVRLRQMMLEG